MSDVLDDLKQYKKDWREMAESLVIDFDIAFPQEDDLDDLLTRTIAEIERLRSGWMPIETAPKDGTLIDLWDSGDSGDSSGYRICNARWDYHHWLNGKPQGEKAWGAGDRDGPFSVNVTHWMPLPQPPQEPK